MTQEEKNLLIIDLAGRLPYGVKGFVQVTNCHDTFREITYKDVQSFMNGTPLTQNYENYDYYIDKVTLIKPYLRPMSDMTEEEKHEYYELLRKMTPGITAYHNVNYLANDWLNKSMFDYRGLIPAGLAFDGSKYF